jgi:hypothetical protein
VARRICLSTGNVREERILDLVIERKTPDNVVKSIVYKKWKTIMPQMEAQLRKLKYCGTDGTLLLIRRQGV